MGNLYHTRTDILLSLISSLALLCSTVAWSNSLPECGNSSVPSCPVCVRLLIDTALPSMQAVGNTFGATALSSYGGFWLSYAVILIPGFNVVAGYLPNDDELNAAISFYLFGVSPLVE